MMGTKEQFKSFLLGKWMTYTLTKVPQTNPPQ
jgi:hypothetical protein